MIVVTPDNEPFVDLVQIRAEGAFGTGLLVGRGLVLTALHCVCDPEKDWQARTDLGVYLLRDLQRDLEHHRSASIVWPPTKALEKRPPDVAVLRIDDPDPPEALAPHRFGELPRAPTLGSARGFPRAAKGPQLPGKRIEHDQPGRVHYTSETRRALTIDATGRHEMEGRERWAGLSGGPLLANGLIVGIMREVPDGWKGEAIEAEPLAPLLRDEVDSYLRTFLGIELPLAESTDPVQAALAKAYAVVGTEAAGASNRTFEAAMSKPFYGRSADLNALDNALKCDRGILLVRGEAGLGKSRLMAHWAERSAENPRDKALRHAFSVREGAAGTRAAMVANLVRQAANVLGPQALGEGEPGETARLADRLAVLLATDRPAGDRLVVVLDGLDEAAVAEPIEPWTDLGRGVFILATCRAEAGEEPRALRVWRERADESNLLVLHHVLPPLDAKAIAEWLTEATGQQVVETDPLIVRAMQASEGVPLFASYLIPDAIEALQAGKDDPFPASFGDYARQRLTELRDRLAQSGVGRWSWGEVLELFALLSVAKASLPPAALRELVGPHRLDELDQRAERWLWRRAEDGGAVSFAHPRLAAVFGTVLPQFEPDIVFTAEERLVSACASAWNAAGRKALRAYALAWLPAHLMGLDRSQEAAELLGDGAFLRARLVANPTTATVRATASETFRLDRRLADTHPASDWRHFWSETESRVVFAVDRADVLGLTAEGVLAQLANDRFGAEGPAFRSLASALRERSPPGMRLMRPCGFRYPALLRSLDGAHEGGVGGVLALADGLVSWGWDGAIRFWSLAGEPRPGGAPKAHEGMVGGVLALADGLVSWGEDGAIRFWSLAGEPRPGGDPKAHEGGVRGWGIGVLALADGLVSWGEDGAIRFWSLAGKPRPGGDPKAQEGMVRGVLALADGLVSWGRAIRFWSLAGEPRPGGAPKAHEGMVGGVLALADGLVSWGEDGAIRFWSLAGEPRPGGDRLAHEHTLSGGVMGVLALADGLVSWGRDGAIRFWSLAGEPRPGGDPKAHERTLWGWGIGVLALADGLVSWGRDGAIRFWSLAGEPRPGGDPKAHEGGVRGVLALADGLVSWGRDGAIRFWSLAGEPRPGGAPKAHEGQVGGVLALADGLVSWDGAIRFWSLAGEPRPSGDPKAQEGMVGGVLALADGLVIWGRAIRFWSLAGEPRPGGAPKAHEGMVGGVLALADGLVSWGRDGAIRFWSLAGEPRPGGDPKAHEGQVWGVVMGVLALADGLVSWGEDGAIRFWSLAGEPRPGGDPKAHEGGVGGVLALADGLVSWGWDGAIRFWSLAGEPRPGGDPKAHEGGVRGVLALADGLVSWGEDPVIHRWGFDGTPKGPAWIAPAPVDMITTIDNDLWVGMLGRPHRLLIDEPLGA